MKRRLFLQGLLAAVVAPVVAKVIPEAKNPDDQVSLSEIENSQEQKNVMSSIFEGSDQGIKVEGDFAESLWPGINEFYGNSYPKGRIK